MELVTKVNQISATLNSDEVETKDYLLSLITFIAGIPQELSTDMEGISKIVYDLMSRLHKSNDQRTLHEEYLDYVTSIRDKHYFTVSYVDRFYRINVRDATLFNTILLTSIKYDKKLFKLNDLGEEDERNITLFIKLMLSTLRNTIPQSIYVLRVLEALIRKRGSVLTPELSLVILKVMTKMVVSPLTGFKRYAHDISRIVIASSLSENIKEHIRNFDHFPIKGIELADNVKLCKGDDIRSCCYQINQQILRLFCYNVDSRDGSFYYEAVLNVHSFEEFKKAIWPLYYPRIRQFKEKGEFYNCLLKYWIPINLTHYQSKFYLFIRDKDIDFQLKAHVLLAAKKSGFYDEDFDSDALNFLQYPSTDSLGLAIICTYTKKSVCPNRSDIRAVEIFLNSYSRNVFSEDILKSLKRFLSQIFLLSHITLSKRPTENLSSYTKFLKFLIRFCYRRIYGECCDFASQLLKLVWDVGLGSSSDLLTLYKLDRENTYEAEGNLYYKQLNDREDWKNLVTNRFLINRIRQFLLKESYHCPGLIQLIIERYLPHIDLYKFGNVMLILDNSADSINLQNLERMRSYCNLVIARDKFGKGTHTYDSTLLEQLSSFYRRSFDNKNLFCAAVLFDIFRTLARYQKVNIFPLLLQYMLLFNEIFDHSRHTHLNIKTMKILEALIINVIDCFLLLKDYWVYISKSRVLTTLCKIVRNSNMKKPISSTVGALRKFGIYMEENARTRHCKMHMLNVTLKSIFNADYRLQSKMRRSPETRLVIHCLSLTDIDNPKKPYLAWSLDFLIRVASNASTPDHAKSSALHCLEMLVSDNSIHQFTLPYIPRIVPICITCFDSKSWVVRNADLQLLKALIERFLGVSLDYCCRPKTVEDLFVLFPELTIQFNKVLSLPQLNDSAVVVLLFFSESRLKSNLLIDLSLEKIINHFRNLFVHIVKSYSNNLGLLAMKAFTSVCFDENVPIVFYDVVDYIKQNFVNMRKNVLANFLRLLHELYNKHVSSLNRENLDLINFAMDDLKNFLRQHDRFYFNLLSLKLLNVDDIAIKFSGLSEGAISYETRIWLYNYVPFMIENVESTRLSSLLAKVLFSDIPDSVHVKILSILVDKFGKTDSRISSEVMNVLFLKLTKLQDSDTHLVTSYAKSILLLNEISCNYKLQLDVVGEVRGDFQTVNIYKIMVYVIALFNVDQKTEGDHAFLDYSIKNYIGNIEKDEILFDLSSTIIYLYIGSPVSSRYDLLKLAFYLLLKDSSYFEICKFIACITKTKCSTILIALNRFLDPRNLLNCLGDEKTVIKFLLDLFYYANELPEGYKDTDTFYLIEIDHFVPKLYVTKLIKSSLFKCSAVFGKS